MKTLTSQSPPVNLKCHAEDPAHAECSMGECKVLEELHAKALDFTDCKQWLEVRCSKCGPLATGEQKESAEAERIQLEHSDEHRGHRVNVELFYRTAVSTRINGTPKGTPSNDQQLDRR